MKKPEVSDSDKRLLLILLALVLLAGSYFLVFNKYTTKAASVEESNVTDRAEVQKLESMAARETEVREETEKLNAHVEEIIAKYPADVTTEKAIAIVKGMEDSTGVKITQASFIMDNLVLDLSASGAAEEGVPMDTASDGTGETETAVDGTDAAESASDGTTGTENAADGADEAAEAAIGYYADLTMNYEASYDDFKKMVTYVKSLEDRTTVPAVACTFDNETGLLTGTVSFHMYYLTGTGKEYEAPSIDGTQKGVSNIFGSSLPKKATAAGSDEE